MLKKITSRKFWISVAAMCASIAISIEGLHSDNEYVAIVGIICAVASSAIYAGCEAYVDSFNVEEKEEDGE